MIHLLSVVGVSVAARVSDAYVTVQPRIKRLVVK